MRGMHRTVSLGPYAAAAATGRRERPLQRPKLSVEGKLRTAAHYSRLTRLIPRHGGLFRISSRLAVAGKPQYPGYGPDTQSSSSRLCDGQASFSLELPIRRRVGHLDTLYETGCCTSLTRPASRFQYIYTKL